MNITATFQPAQLDEGAADAVARLDVVGGGLEDLGVQLDRPRPIRVEGGGDGLIGEGADAQTGVG